MKLVKRSLVLFFLSASILFSLAAEEEKKNAVNPVYPGPYQMRVEKEKVHASIPVTLREGVKLESGSFNILQVKFNDEERQDMKAIFNVQFIEETKSNYSLLHINLPTPTPGKRDTFGTYQLTLSIAVDDRFELLDVMVIYPQTKLEQLEAQFFKSTRFLWWVSSKNFPLYIKVEKGPPLVSLRIDQEKPATVDNYPVNGRLNFITVAAKIDNDNTVSVPIELAEAFPLGSASGEFIIEAPGVEPSKVKFIMTTQWNTIIIPILALIGILIGYLVHNQLETNFERKKHRLQYLNLLGRVKNNLEKSKDKLFQDGLQQLELKISNKLEASEESIEKLDSSKLKQEYDDLEKKLNDAIDDLDKRGEEFKQQYNELQNIFNTNFILPALLDAVNARVKDQAQELGNLIQQGNFTEAEEKLNHLWQSWESELRSTFSGWFKHLKPDFKRSEQTNIILPSEVIEAFSIGLEPITNACETELIDLCSEGKDAITKILTTAHTYRPQVITLFKTLIDSLDKTVSIIYAHLFPHLDHNQGKKFLDSIIAARDIWIRLTPTSVVNDPQKGMANLVQKADDVTDSLYIAIMFSVSSASQKTQMEVEELLLQGQYKKAVELIPKPAPKSVTRGTIMGKTTPQASGTPIISAPTQPSPTIQDDPNLRPSQAITCHTYAGLSKKNIQYEKTKTRKELLKAEFLQTLISAVGISALAWFAFETNFIGTPKEMLAIFMWGFSADISLKFAIAKAKEVSKN
jgi:hypothetical protein